jgi:hypothetical protein
LWQNVAEVCEYEFGVVVTWPLNLVNIFTLQGNEHEVVGAAAHSETRETMAVYRALYGEGGLWVRPPEMWNEMVEYNGRRVKRFPHIDDIMPEPESPAGIHERSKPIEKIELILSLFAGRCDVFAERWENAQKNKSGFTYLG